jgi:hypothetical protein
MTALQALNELLRRMQEHGCDADEGMVNLLIEEIKTDSLPSLLNLGPRPAGGD